MSKLIKEEVIAQFTAAYVAKNGKEPTIEQKGSWFKVDGGKSVRLTELAAQIEEIAAPATAKAAPETKKAKVAKQPVAKGNGGLSPKQLWAQKLAKGSKLPRGL